MVGKPILCLDFDGVIHSYTSGWRGPDVVSDPPVPGAFGFILAAQDHFNVMIFSSRSNQPDGIAAMQEWFFSEAKKIFGFGDELPKWLADVNWPTEKPAAFLTIDDRALMFEGMWPDVQGLLAFKPWNKR